MLLGEVSGITTTYAVDVDAESAREEGRQRHARHGVTDVQPWRAAGRHTCTRRLRKPLASWASAGAIVAVVLLPGCGVFNREAPANWDLAPDQTIDATSTTFTALVTRASCNSGVTGVVNAPDVKRTDDRVLLTFTVSPGRPSSAACQGNDAVRYEVELFEELGDRALVDGECEVTLFERVTGRGVVTGACHPDGVRYAP